MKKTLQKILNILIIPFLLVLFTIPVSAQDGNCGDAVNIESIKCNLGWSDIDTSNVLVQRNPIDYIVIVFQLLLAFVIIFAIFKIVMAGIKIIGAGEDADKRTEGLKAVVNAIIGLVIALSAFGIAEIVRKSLGANVNYEVLCQNIPDDASQNLKDSCSKFQGYSSNNSGSITTNTKDSTPICSDDISNCVPYNGVIPQNSIKCINTKGTRVQLYCCKPGQNLVNEGTLKCIK